MAEHHPNDLWHDQQIISENPHPKGPSYFWFDQSIIGSHYEFKWLLNILKPEREIEASKMKWVSFKTLSAGNELCMPPNSLTGWAFRRVLVQLQPLSHVSASLTAPHWPFLLPVLSPRASPHRTHRSLPHNIANVISCVVILDIPPCSTTWDQSYHWRHNLHFEGKGSSISCITEGFKVLARSLLH